MDYFSEIDQDHSPMSINRSGDNAIKNVQMCDIMSLDLGIMLPLSTILFVGPLILGAFGKGFGAGSLILFSIGISMFFMCCAYYMSYKTHLEKGGKSDDYGWGRFLLGDDSYNKGGNGEFNGEFNWGRFGKSFGVGLASGIVFGFIDNFGLFFGMDKLDPLFSKLPGGSEELVKAGYGNTFSDLLGAFVATFIGKIIVVMSGTENTPIFADALGVGIGCLFGVGLGRVIKGNPNK